MQLIPVVLNLEAVGTSADGAEDLFLELEDFLFRVILQRDGIAGLEGEGLEFAIEFGLEATPGVPIGADEVTAMLGRTVVELPVGLLQLVDMAGTHPDPRRQLGDFYSPFFHSTTDLIDKYLPYSEGYIATTLCVPVVTISAVVNVTFMQEPLKASVK